MIRTILLVIITILLSFIALLQGIEHYTPDKPANTGQSFIVTPDGGTADAVMLYPGPTTGPEYDSVDSNTPVDMICWTDTTAGRLFKIRTTEAAPRVGYVGARFVLNQRVVDRCLG
ncbi:hypothetical protein JNJ66_01825 [Candidatus Saccharibacteria bacterium]|nr:hypothetical protein [Candidatus Saccharibacteria bacterium]